jgi:hypothetical protein
MCANSPRLGFLLLPIRGLLCDRARNLRDRALKTVGSSLALAHPAPLFALGSHGARSGGYFSCERVKSKGHRERLGARNPGVCYRATTVNRHFALALALAAGPVGLLGSHGFMALARAVNRHARSSKM